ncbi:unnamed protein product [Absidia cylindrospora]
MTSSPDISFEHFDPTFELGSLDPNGKAIRIRKKPGRKPNPPSPAQRKAQNRAAQRAFRERKRCEMKQAETTVKQSLYIRDQALGEAQRLKMKLEETRYENNYLKGSLLTLKLACIANKVDVPELWDSEASADSIDVSKTKDLPQAMGVFLDKDRNIINLSQGNGSYASNCTSPVSVPLSPGSLTCSSPSSMVDLNQHEILPPLSSSPGSSYSGSNGSDSVQDLPSTITNPSQCLSLGSDHSFGTDYMSGLTGLTTSSTINSNLVLPLDYDRVTESLGDASHTTNNETMINLDKWLDTTSSPLQSIPVLDPKTGLERHRTILLDAMEDHLTVPPLSLSAMKLKSAPPMNTMEALQYIRMVKNLDNDTRVLFRPTEIQRTIPHDTRIDHVPGPMMRDMMILYQDFYNANELFDLLMGSAMFLGGELENSDCWMVPPEFLHKFWFLCPNHRPQRLDNLTEMAVDMGQKMIKMMMERKAMHFDNGRFGDDNLPFTESMHQQQHSQLYGHYQEQLHEKDMMSFDAIAKDDYSLDSMMIFVDDNDLLASV